MICHIPSPSASSLSGWLQQNIMCDDSCSEGSAEYAFSITASWDSMKSQVWLIKVYKVLFHLV